MASRIISHYPCIMCACQKKGSILFNWFLFPDAIAKYVVNISHIFDVYCMVSRK
ncbi:hypothetical protein Csa_005524, partial [Cucumis sativus]